MQNKHSRRENIEKLEHDCDPETLFKAKKDIFRFEIDIKLRCPVGFIETQFGECWQIKVDLDTAWLYLWVRSIIRKLDNETTVLNTAQKFANAREVEQSGLGPLIWLIS